LAIKSRHQFSPTRNRLSIYSRQQKIERSIIDTWKELRNLKHLIKRRRRRTRNNSRWISRSRRPHRRLRNNDISSVIPSHYSF
jgi:hypothetical protein